MSLATAPASAVFVLAGLLMDFSPGFNESEVGTVEFSYLKGDRYGLVELGFVRKRRLALMSCFLDATCMYTRSFWSAQGTVSYH